MRYSWVLPLVLLVSVVQVSELPMLTRFPVDVLMLKRLIRTKVQGEPLDEGFNFCALFVWGIDATGHSGFHKHSKGNVQNSLLAKRYCSTIRTLFVPECLM